MKERLKTAPRRFSVGDNMISDHGSLELTDGDMVSLTLKDGQACEITAKEWGFYLAPSLNGRFREYGFKTALVANAENKLFLNAVLIGAENEFNAYLKKEHSRVLLWLDDYAPSGDIK